MTGKVPERWRRRAEAPLSKAKKGISSSSGGIVVESRGHILWTSVRGDREE